MLLLVPTSAYTNHAGHKFHEVFQMKHGGGYSGLPASKISKLMKSNSLDVITLALMKVPELFRYVFFFAFFTL